MKILLYNVAYCLGYNGSLSSYFFNAYRCFVCPKYIQRKKVREIKTLLKECDPDICCFIEIDKGNRVGRRINQIESISGEEYQYYDIENKYGQHTLFSKIPYFRSKSNAFLAKEQQEFSKHYLKKGPKKLVYEIKIDDELSLFSVHLSLHSRTRKKQINELAQLVRKRKKVIVCGDFNVFKGFKELEPLLKEAGLKIINNEKEGTFPSIKPKMVLDIFLCSQGLEVKDFKILDHFSSDHLPVLLEI